MGRVMVEERDKITDRLEGILADIRYLEYDDPTIAVDTLDGCVAQCAEILTRIKRLRRWVRMEMEDGVPLEAETELGKRMQHWVELTEEVEVPF